MAIHEITFPGETEAFRIARDDLLRAEMELRAKIEEVALRRRELPLGGLVEDYVFEGVEGSVRLSELFAESKSSLVLYSYMFGPEDEQPCPMCSSYLDGTDGVVTHIERRINFAVVVRSPIERVQAVAEARGWSNLPLLSAADNNFAQDFHTETSDGRQLPICNVFVKRDDGVHHFWASEMFFAPTEWHPRHVDLLMPLWHYLDLTPEGRGDFFPSLDYAS